jgi:hypothetical protein
MIVPVVMIATVVEVRLAICVGKTRAYSAGVIGMRQRYGSRGPDIDADIRGALAEQMLARYAGYDDWWGTIADTKAVDVGRRHQVRSINRPDRRLIVHDTDSDSHFFTLALVYWPKSPEVRLIGWLLGKEAKALGRWCDPQGTDRSAYFVDINKLHDMRDLPTRKELGE